MVRRKVLIDYEKKIGELNKRVLGQYLLSGKEIGKMKRLIHSSNETNKIKECILLKNKITRDVACVRYVEDERDFARIVGTFSATPGREETIPTPEELLQLNRDNKIRCIGNKNLNITCYIRIESFKNEDIQLLETIKPSRENREIIENITRKYIDKIEVSR